MLQQTRQIRHVSYHHLPSLYTGADLYSETGNEKAVRRSLQDQRAGRAAPGIGTRRTRSEVLVSAVVWGVLGEGSPLYRLHGDTPIEGWEIWFNMIEKRGEEGNDGCSRTLPMGST